MHMIVNDVQLYATLVEVALDLPILKSDFKDFVEIFLRIRCMRTRHLSNFCEIFSQKVENSRNLRN